MNDRCVFCLQVLVTPLTERGFLILLSSVQMATPTGMAYDNIDMPRVIEI